MLPSVYHAIDLISQDYGSLPHKVFEKSSEGKSLIEDHNIYRLLNFEPNYYQTPFEYHRMMGVNRLMYGNAYAIIDRYEGSAQIRNLIPVHPANVKDIIEHQGELFYEIQEVDGMISMFDMIHVKDLSINKGDFKGGSRLVDYCTESIGGGLATQEFSSAFFGNGAHPGLIFESEAGALEDEEQRVAVKNSIKKGSENSHEAMVLPWGIKVAQGPTQFNPQQSQLLESRIQFVEEVAQIFNLPLNKMRTKTDGNSYASVEQANIEYVTDCLRPFAKAFEQEYNKKAFSSGERGQIFSKVSLEARLRGDMQTQGEFIDKMIKNGTYSVNEARAYLNMNTIGEEGDMHYIQSNQMELGEDPIKKEE